MKLARHIRCPEGCQALLVAELEADKRVDRDALRVGERIYYSVETGMLPDVEPLPPGDVQAYLARLHERLEKVICSGGRAT